MVGLAEEAEGEMGCSEGVVAVREAAEAFSGDGGGAEVGVEGGIEVSHVGWLFDRLISHVC
jgi:hypothetical protein